MYHTNGNQFILFSFLFFQKYQKSHKQCVITADGKNALRELLQRTLAPQIIFDTLCTKNRF
jgi:hypothetical protein